MQEKTIATICFPPRRPTEQVPNDARVHEAAQLTRGRMGKRREKGYNVRNDFGVVKGHHSTKNLLKPWL